jgi:exodeoxyribonuclease VII large subunit
MHHSDAQAQERRVWQVGALCRAIADALDARFNPVTVGGEISGFTRAASGHCYFSLKDDSGQIRCAMFRRAAGLLNFDPRDGERVEVRGRLGVYEPRGELQMVVESMAKAGQGTLFEEFLKLKSKLESEGLFDSTRKRALPLMPRGIGLVTSLGAAALHDVVTALQRRVPHVPVVLVPATVQGEGAAKAMVQSLNALYAMNIDKGLGCIDVILLVRGGGAMEDLWSFNDEVLARTIARSPVPLISGVGHETDFTIADFVADLRAPTPTAAAELVCQPTAVWRGTVDLVQGRMEDALVRYGERQSQRLDLVANRIGRPSVLSHRMRLALVAAAQRLQHAAGVTMRERKEDFSRVRRVLPQAVGHALRAMQERKLRARLGLESVNPSQVLRRGYARLTTGDGQTISSVAQTRPSQHVRAILADGTVEMSVLNESAN